MVEPARDTGVGSGSGIGSEGDVTSGMLVRRIRSAIGRTSGIVDNLAVDPEAGIPGVSLKVGSEPRGDPILGLIDRTEPEPQSARE